MKKTFALLLTMGATVASAAVYSPVGFTESEKRRHDRQVDFIVEEAATCLKEQLYHHQDFYKKWGISPFYGDQSRYAKLVYKNGIDATGGLYEYKDEMARKNAFLQDVARRLNRVFPEDMAEKLKPTSCIGLTLQCLGQGFKSMGQEDIWKKVNDYTSADGVTGGSLQHALQELGWKILYWNPDISQNSAWDEREEREFQESNESRDRRVFRGQHSYVYNAQIRSRVKRDEQPIYFRNKVDNTSFLVNFGSRAPQKFNNIPFFLGVAHGGYHVFPGFYGEVIEGHSTRPLTDYKTIETDMFNPVFGGSPKASGRSIYRSGVIAIPPHHIADSEGPNSNGDDRCVEDIEDF